MSLEKHHKESLNISKYSSGKCFSYLNYYFEFRNFIFERNYLWYSYESINSIYIWLLTKKQRMTK